MMMLKKITYFEMNAVKAFTLKGSSLESQWSYCKVLWLDRVNQCVSSWFTANTLFQLSTWVAQFAAQPQGHAPSSGWTAALHPCITYSDSLLLVVTKQQDTSVCCLVCRPGFLKSSCFKQHWGLDIWAQTDTVDKYCNTLQGNWKQVSKCFWHIALMQIYSVKDA